jgi:hypothetical protein
MKTSANGAEILHGGGLQSVRERIQRAFQEIHNGIVLGRDIELVEEIKLDAAPLAQKPLRSLSVKGEPILRVAVQCHKDGGTATPTKTP